MVAISHIHSNDVAFFMSGLLCTIECGFIVSVSLSLLVRRPDSSITAFSSYL